MAAGLGPLLIQAASPAERREVYERVLSLVSDRRYRHALDALYRILDDGTPLEEAGRSELAASLLHGAADAIVLPLPGGPAVMIDGGTAEYRLDQHRRALRLAPERWSWLERPHEISRALATLDSARRIEWIGWLMPFIPAQASMDLLDSAAQVASGDKQVAAEIGLGAAGCRHRTSAPLAGRCSPRRPSATTPAGRWAPR